MSADLLERCIGTLRAMVKRFYELVTPQEQPRAQAWKCEPRAPARSS